MATCKTKMPLMAIALLLLSLPLHAQQSAGQPRWVVDELTTFVRSGPTDAYRIVGTLTAGEAVRLLETSGQYSLVRNARGNDVWILSRELSSTPSSRERLPDLEAQVESLSSELQGINLAWERRLATMTETLGIREQQIADLEARNRDLDTEVQRSRQTLRQLQARLDTQEEDLLLRYFLYGGGVAGLGLLAGLLIPLFPWRRKRRDTW